MNDLRPRRFSKDQGVAAVLAAGLFLSLGSCGTDPVSQPPMQRSGGSPGTGGSDSGAGTTASGGVAGSVSSGGASSAGKGSGGSVASGGSSASGGSKAQGGSPMEAGSGGADPEGGTMSTGGDPSVGGEPGVGGDPSMGGEPGVGGEPGTGGEGGAPTPPDREEFFGDSRCTDEFLLCEDFEAEELDEGRWLVEGTGVPTIETTRAARGTRSAHIHTEDNGFVSIRQDETFPADGNTYYARAFFWFDSMPTAPMDAHWSIAGAVGSGTESEIRVGGQFNGEQNVFGVGTDRGETGDWTRHDNDPAGAPLPVPVQEWVCIEWLHKGDTNETRFYWDGVEHPSLHTTATDHDGADGEEYILPTFESVWFGWWHYQPGTDPPEFDVWMDEIVVDDEPIGCIR